MEGGLLLPSVNGFRLCRSHALPCAHFTARRAPAHGRTPLRVSNASGKAEAVPLEHLSFDGSDKGTKELALRVAGPETATGLVHRYVTMAQQNKRQGTASTLTRAEVSGGGRKPFAQKGTGNARQGSIRTPLKPGGGVIFGPKPRDWSIKMNKKERRLAYATAFQNAAESITVVDDLEGSLTQPKTKELLAALKRWGIGPEAHTLIIVDRLFENLNLAGRNVRNVVFNSISNLSVYDLLRADRIVVESSALAFIQEFYGTSSSPNSKAVAPDVTYAETNAPADEATVRAAETDLEEAAAAKEEAEAKKQAAAEAKKQEEAEAKKQAAAEAKAADAKGKKAAAEEEAKSEGGDEAEPESKAQAETDAEAKEDE